MFNFLKDKRVIEFADSLLLGKEYYESLAYRVADLDESENLHSNIIALKRIYCATYLFHTLHHFKSVGNVEKFNTIESEIFSRLDKSIYSLYAEIGNHISNEEFPFLENSAQWIFSKYNFNENLKALILAHQYIIKINSLEAHYWKIFNLTSYSQESFIELYTKREKNKKLATMVLIELIGVDLDNVRSYLNYKELDTVNCDRVILISRQLLMSKKEIDSQEIHKFVILCDPIHHYARGVGDVYALCGQRIRDRCQLLDNLFTS